MISPKPIPTLGPERRLPIEGTEGLYMRVADDLRRAVVFFGFADSAAVGGIACVGTGFLVTYEGQGYLVTCGHLARPLESVPFLIRVNRNDGGSQNLPADGMKWFHHPDPSVDVSISPLWLPILPQLSVKYIEGENIILDPRSFILGDIGVGNATYTIGLFRLMSGQKRNLPIVHYGSIAMVPSDEKIPVRDWLAPAGVKRTRFVEGYLVESQSLGGLSGSPVFVRPDFGLKGLPQDHKVPMRTGADGVIVLGIWQGAWDSPPDEVMAAEHGKEARVPVGVGIVIPGHRIKEVFDMDDVKAHRDEARRRRENLGAADLNSAFPAKPSLPSTDANPTHREDFTRLVGAAARKPPQED